MNYQQECFDNWQSGYFGDNYDRLLRVKAKYDRYGRFDKAYTVQARGRSSLR